MSSLKYEFDEYSPEDTIRKIIGRNMTRYQVLDDIINKDIIDLKTFVINGDSILIDLHKFLDRSSKDLKNIDFVYIISSSIINVIAHYRYYFAIHGWYPKIYFLADKNDDNAQIRESMEIISMILKYVDNTYFIDMTNLATGIIIKYFLKKNKENLILTRDDFDIMHISENTYVLRAAKDKSKFYTCNNWQKNISKKLYMKYNNISYELLNMIMCFSGAHERPGVKGIGARTMLKKISNAIEAKDILNGRYYNIDDFISDMSGYFKKHDLKPARDNFRLYDVESNYDRFVTKAIEKRLDSYIEDKFSKKDLIMLNTKYFTGLNSLMLEELMIRPKSEKSKTRW